MGRKINWTQPALEDLRDLVAYIAKDDPAASIRVGDKIVDHVELLKNFPEIGPICRRRPEGDVREILSYPFRIFYRISKKRNLVEILHVWHGARDEPANTY